MAVQLGTNNTIGSRTVGGRYPKDYANVQFGHAGTVRLTRSRMARADEQDEEGRRKDEEGLV